MRTFAASLIPLAILGAVRGSDGREWPRPNGAEAVPTARGPVSAGQSMAGTVRLVGHGGGAGTAPQQREAHTFAVELPAPGSPGPSAASDAQPEGVPREALWPDARGRIQVGPDAGRGELAGRNPWEVRTRRDGAKDGTVITCGGIIAPRGAEAVALLNGRVERRGGAVEGLSVEGVTPDAAVLQAGGSLVVIPRGMRVTVVR